MARTKLGKRFIGPEDRGREALVEFISGHTGKYLPYDTAGLAKAIGMEPHGLYRRLRGETRFSHAEICRIIRVLNPTDEEILSFFGREPRKGKKSKNEAIA